MKIIFSFNTSLPQKELTSSKVSRIAAVAIGALLTAAAALSFSSVAPLMLASLGTHAAIAMSTSGIALTILGISIKGVENLKEKNPDDANSPQEDLTQSSESTSPSTTIPQNRSKESASQPPKEPSLQTPKLPSYQLPKEPSFHLPKLSSTQPPIGTSVQPPKRPSYQPSTAPSSLTKLMAAHKQFSLPKTRPRLQSAQPQTRPRLQSAQPQTRPRLQSAQPQTRPRLQSAQPRAAKNSVTTNEPASPKPVFYKPIRPLGSSPFSTNNRPNFMQNSIQTMLNALFRKPRSDWGCTNDSTRDKFFHIDNFLLVGEVLKLALEHHPSEKAFNIIDIGAGNHQWGKDLLNYIQKHNPYPGKMINIYSVGAENNSQKPIRNNQCTLYCLGKFAVENFRTTIANKAPILNGNIDFALSSWCLQHLTDPVGTLVEIYNALRPKTGHMLFTGFRSILLTEEMLQNGISQQQIKELDAINPTISSLNVIALLKLMNIPFLRLIYQLEYSFDQFLIQRNSTDPLEASNIDYIDNINLHYRNQKRGTYNNPNNQLCIRTSAYLVKSIEKPLTIEMLTDNSKPYRFHGDKDLYERVRGSLESEIENSGNQIEKEQLEEQLNNFELVELS